MIVRLPMTPFPETNVGGVPIRSGVQVTTTVTAGEKRAVGAIPFASNYKKHSACHFTRISIPNPVLLKSNRQLALRLTHHSLWYIIYPFFVKSVYESIRLASPS